MAPSVWPIAAATPSFFSAPMPVGNLTWVEVPTFDLNSGLTVER